MEPSVVWGLEGILMTLFLWNGGLWYLLRTQRLTFCGFYPVLRESNVNFIRIGILILGVWLYRVVFVGHEANMILEVLVVVNLLLPLLAMAER